MIRITPFVIGGALCCRWMIWSLAWWKRLSSEVCSTRRMCYIHQVRGCNIPAAYSMAVAPTCCDLLCAMELTRGQLID